MDAKLLAEVTVECVENNVNFFSRELGSGFFLDLNSLNSPPKKMFYRRTVPGYVDSRIQNFLHVETSVIQLVGNHRKVEVQSTILSQRSFFVVTHLK